MEEIWKNIGKNYQVSNLGNIRKLKQMKQNIDKSGYLSLRLNIGEGEKAYKVHRLVASMFIKGDFDSNEVNHKDGNKQNNNANNLEWVTSRDNIIHALNNYQYKNKPVICVETGERYVSISQAAREVNRDKKVFKAALDKPHRTCAGYHWVTVQEGTTTTP